MAPAINDVYSYNNGYLACNIIGWRHAPTGAAGMLAA